jgi:hypothetical protein
MTHSITPTRYSALLRLYVLFSAGFGTLFAVEAGNAKVVSFDIPAEVAALSLKRFSTQSGIEIIIESDLGRTVRTNEVRGEMPPREAIQRMLSGTGLEVVESAKSGAFAIRRGTRDPNGERAERTSARRPAPQNPIEGSPDVSRTDTTGGSRRISDGPAVSRGTREAGKTDEIVVISPFEVTAGVTGYYASNTLSGTRLNSKLEDLGSSITVVTKQQMADFALTDINDIFLYEANTEGTGNFTDYTLDRAGVVIDNAAGGGIGSGNYSGPTGSNRIRGIGQANIAKGNFATSGRVPIDSINIEAVEISRGPNSSIFGLGSASGTVNLLPARAGLRRLSTMLELRGDSYEGTRVALDHNQPIIPGKLALRGSAVYQEDGFERQPALNRTERYNAMLTFQPFRKTTLRGSFERYENLARLPNNVTPRDGISYWIESGRPTWNPVTSTVTRNGVQRVVPFNGNATNESALLGPGLSSTGDIYTRPNLFVEPDGSVPLWTVGRLSGTASPQGYAGNVRYIQSATFPRVGIDATERSVTDSEIYDWTSVNLAAANSVKNKNENFTIEIEQFLVETPRHLLALQAGWYRENADRYRRDFIGQSGDSPMILYIDPNERLLDGSPNPYFRRPYVAAREPVSYRQPLDRDIYRGQVAYQLKLADEKSALRWIGDHTFAGYAESNRTTTANWRFKDAIVSDHLWLAAGTDRANGLSTGKGYYRYYVGDSQGENVDSGPAAWKNGFGTRTFRWRNGVTGAWVDEQATIGEAFWNVTNQNLRRNQSLIKTFGGAWQAHFLGDRIVTTLGLREDSSFNRAGVTRLAADGISRDGRDDGDWPLDWVRRDGRTTTKGVVLKPFRRISGLDRTAGGGGMKGLGADLLRSINLHYNESDSFLPATLAQNLFTDLLPDPTGRGKDYGVSLNVFGDSKLVVRYNEYKTTQLSTRESENGTIASRVARVEINYNGNNDALNLYSLATTWVNTANPGISAAQRESEIAKIMGLPEGQVQRLGSYPIGDTSNVIATGKEIEINYNPTSYWTVKVAAAQQKAIDDGISPNLMRYLAERLPVWTKIIDPIRGTPWYTTDYGGSRPTPEFFLNELVYAPIKLAQANEGKSRSQVREWRVNTLSTLRLDGVTSNKWLSRMSVSGAVRWEDKASIGYYADARDPTVYDANRPIYDKARAYVDMGVSYRTRMFSDKVRIRLQLNVRNAFENGRLQPIGVLPDGTPHTYRIIDPRLFVLTTSFEL